MRPLFDLRAVNRMWPLCTPSHGVVTHTYPSPPGLLTVAFVYSVAVEDITAGHQQPLRVGLGPQAPQGCVKGETLFDHPTPVITEHQLTRSPSCPAGWGRFITARVFLPCACPRRALAVASVSKFRRFAFKGEASVHARAPVWRGCSFRPGGLALMGRP
jgi:hypothetical protein